MFKFIVDWFKKPAPESLATAVTPEAAPYKVEAPTPVVPVVEAKPVEDLADIALAQRPAVAKQAPAKKTAAKKPAAKKAATKKPAAMSAKKPGKSKTK